MDLKLTILPQRLAVCRLSPTVPLPSWSTAGPLWCIARNHDELSIVCSEETIPAEVLRKGGFRALKVEGPLDFSLTDILARLTGALAAASISVFVFSTYDTDYVLVRDDMLNRATQALTTAGIVVVRAAP